MQDWIDIHICQISPSAIFKNMRIFGRYSENELVCPLFGTTGMIGLTRVPFCTYLCLSMNLTESFVFQSSVYVVIHIK